MDKSQTKRRNQGLDAICNPTKHEWYPNYLASSRNSYGEARLHHHRHRHHAPSLCAKLCLCPAHLSGDTIPEMLPCDVYFYHDVFITCVHCEDDLPIRAAVS